MAVETAAGGKLRRLGVRISRLTRRLRPPLTLIRVRGGSMQPTLADGQLLLARPVSADRPGLRRGDIIVFQHPHQPGAIYIKRIIALPNEYLELTAAGISIDDIPRPDLGALVPAAADRDYPRRWHTGPRDYFVLGDHRADSGDSRRFGPIDQKLIQARVCWYRRRGSVVK